MLVSKGEEIGKLVFEVSKHSLGAALTHFFLGKDRKILRKYKKILGKKLYKKKYRQNMSSPANADRSEGGVGGRGRGGGGVGPEPTYSLCIIYFWVRNLRFPCVLLVLGSETYVFLAFYWF